MGRVKLTAPGKGFLEVGFSRVFFSKGFFAVVAGGRFSGQKLKPCRSWRTRPYSSWNCAIRLPSVPTLLENWSQRKKIRVNKRNEIVILHCFSCDCPASFNTHNL